MRLLKTIQQLVHHYEACSQVVDTNVLPQLVRQEIGRERESERARERERDIYIYIYIYTER